MKAGDRATTSDGAEPRRPNESQRRGNTNTQTAAVATESRQEQARYAREIDVTGVEDARLASEELSLVCKCAGDTIDLLLDTGTVSNLVPEESRSVVQGIRNERTALIGVGDARVMALETGEAGVFGRSRIVYLALGPYASPNANSETSSR